MAQLNLLNVTLLGALVYFYSYNNTTELGTKDAIKLMWLVYSCMNSFVVTDNFVIVSCVISYVHVFISSSDMLF